MTIDEMKTQKAETERKIIAALREFSASTGLSVTSVDVRLIDVRTNGGEVETVCSEVEITVSL